MKFKKGAREPISSYTHYFGALLAVIGTFALLYKSIVITEASMKTILSVTVFGLSMILLYLASGTYHYVSGSDEVIRMMRKVDHSAIYLLIAGTYTPIFLNVFSQPKGIYLTVAIWVIGLAGIAVKLLWLEAPRWLYTLAYILMGWFILVDLKSFFLLPTGAIALTFLGGFFYTTGAVFYILKKPNLGRFGFHDVFHLFILAGTISHFFMVYLYIA